MSHLLLCISLLHENRKVLPSSLCDSVIATSRFAQKYYLINTLKLKKKIGRSILIVVDNCRGKEAREQKVDVFAVGIWTDVHYCLQPQVHCNHRHCPDSRLQSQQEICFTNR